MALSKPTIRRDTRSRKGRQQVRPPGYWKRYRSEHKSERPILALDGEGYSLADGRHLYTYLACCSAEGLVSEVENSRGLDTEQVFDWLVSLPRGALLVGYSLGYDTSKWCEAMGDRQLWDLNHPETRPGRFGPKPVRWKEYSVNAVATKFTVAIGAKGARRVAPVWDVFRFFGTSFVKALKTWKVGTDEQVAAIEAMKAQRGNFEGIREREKGYCRDECKLLAQLVGKLVQAHEDVGLPLKSYYGPGSTASVMLKAMAAREQRAVRTYVGRHFGVVCRHQEPGPQASEAFETAFFGGRFENSRVGPVRQPVYSYDIASAYPYAMTQLPCFAHGRWKHVKRPRERDLRDAQTYCASFRLERSPSEAWGPLPHRLGKAAGKAAGNILFPTQGPGGWAWAPEVQSAHRQGYVLDLTEAWVYRTQCDCPPPFAARVAEWYCARLKWGKSDKGLTLKLGLNSCYGKSAQRVGSGLYRCIVRAGLITSMCRAMLLDAIGAARDPWAVLSVATDGILSTEPLTLPWPRITGTEAAAREYATGEKRLYPLGAWEAKEYPRGVFLIRPGLRFSLDFEHEADTTAARGLGVRVLHEQRQAVVDAWERNPMGELEIQQPAMFHGRKSCVRRLVQDHEHTGEAVEVFRRDALYGRWSVPEPRKVGYQAEPKRRGVEELCLYGHDRPTEWRLTSWQLPMAPEARSVPYRDAPRGSLALEAQELRDLEDEQPDGEPLGALGD